MCASGGATKDLHRTTWWQPVATFDALYEYIQDATSVSCTLIHAYPGIVALSVAPRNTDPDMNQRVATASEALHAQLDPKAYYHVYSVAAVHIAAGIHDKALARL